MKEYRLLKWYPGLPKEWKDLESVVVVEEGFAYNLHPSIKVKPDLYQRLLSIEEVESNPEYWERIVPEDKEYKLIKVYPSVHPFMLEGDIVRLNITGRYVHSTFKTTTYSPREVEEFPEFWKEVKKS